MIVNQLVIFKRPKNWLSDSCRGLDIPESELKFLLASLLDAFMYKVLSKTIYTLVNNGDMAVFVNAPSMPIGGGITDFVTKVHKIPYDEYYLKCKEEKFSFRFMDHHIQHIMRAVNECMGRLIISDIKKEYYKWLLIKNVSIDIDSASEISKFLILSIL